MSDFSSLAQQAINSLGAHPWVISAFFFFIAFVAMLLISNPMIEWLRNKQWKKGISADETWAVREDTPDTHQIKRGTPSMGGIGIILSTLLSLLALPALGMALAGLSKPGTTLFPTMSWPAVLTICLSPLVLLSHGVLGFSDDWSKASGRGGLRARSKLAGQILLAIAFVTNLTFITLSQSSTRSSYILFNIDSMTWVALLLSFSSIIFVVIATCNAVNLTDGIDGLAAGLAVQCGVVLYLAGNYYGISLLSMWSSVALAGACLGFLNFNKYKARVFMGDTGSLAIGAALGAGAILQGAVFLLPFMGFIYFVEMFSVIAQVIWFKWTKRKTGEGKRLFRRAPLHHHFELGGWSEWRVVGTFWVINLFTSAIGLLLWHAGVLPRWP